MANHEHVKILKQGVEVWNKWRKDNPSITQDLYGADLSKANLGEARLSEANLSGANLYYAHLRYAYLSNANLSYANLGEANLSGANLSGANLFGVNLCDANLNGAILSKADLTDAYLSNADLSASNLSKSILSGADLSFVDICGADLRGADLSGASIVFADLRDADLSDANLRGAKLRRATLIGANLSRTDLPAADLRESLLIRSNLKGATITSTLLYGSSRKDWVIDEVKCDYVYWDDDGKERTPKDRDFEPGEFEALYKSLPTIEYHFERGFTPIDAVLMNKIVQEIRERNPEFELSLDSFHSRGTPRAVFTVLHKEVADQALKEIKHDYEKRIIALEAERDTLDKYMSRLIDKPKTEIRKLVMGDNIKGDQVKTTGQTGDAVIAKDQATVNIQKITNPVAKDLLEQISNLILSDDVSDDDKADAQQQLSNMAKELEKPQPEKGRLKRFYYRMIDVVPKIAAKLPWGKIVEQLMLG